MDDSEKKNKKDVIVLNPPSPNNAYINRDLMGGMGVHITFGKNIFARFLSKIKQNYVKIPVVQLVYAATLLEKNNYNVTVIDAANESMGLDSVLEKIEAVKPAHIIMAVSSSCILFERDVVAAKIWSVKSKGIDMALKGKGLGKLEEGFLFRIIPSRVPRVIGREGSMINLIKDKTSCNITVGQNGWIWVKGQTIESEILARKAIEFVADKVFVNGLTEKVEQWFEEKK